jgi:hypothetical protein
VGERQVFERMGAGSNTDGTYATHATDVTVTISPIWATSREHPSAMLSSHSAASTNHLSPLTSHLSPGEPKASPRVAEDQISF